MSSRQPADDTEAVVYRWFEDLFTGGNLGVADEILADDVSYHGPPSLSPQDVTEPEDIKQYVDVYQTAFPDLAYNVEDVSPTGDGLCVLWSATGTHESDLFDMEPTGEMFHVDGINHFEIEDGKITRIEAEWDTLKMVQELGIVPPIGVAME